MAALPPDPARLRIAAFRGWPRLHDGGEAGEPTCLRFGAESSGAVIVGARDAACLGAATGARLEDCAAELAVSREVV